MEIIETTMATKELVDLEPIAKVTTPNDEIVLTKTVIDQAVVLLREVEKNGGYGDISNIIGHDKISKSQVKRIHAGMQTRIAELNYIEPVVEEVITK